MDNKNPLQKREAENPPKLSKTFLDVLKRNLAVFAEHYRQPISELSTIAYRDDLADLTPAELEAACIHARKTSEFMPTSAAVLKAHEELCGSGQEEYLGVPQIDYPPVTQEERDAALEYSEKLKETLVKMEEETWKPSPSIPQASRSYFEIYRPAYLTWLKKEQENDDMASAQGLSPLPRSKEERLAMFYNLPLQERKRLRRKAEWTKLSTGNM